MKELITLLILALPFASTLKAQDVITLKDSTNINAKILEITTSEIKYKKYSYPDGPIYTIKKSDVLIICYENGEKDIFSETQQADKLSLNTTEPIVEGMKYNEYRKYYNTQLYHAQRTDPYSRGWAGIASVFITGLGQGVAGEWGRGAFFFLGNLSIKLLSYTQIYRYVDIYGYTYYSATGLYWILLSANLALDIWSICDAVHIAKVKNMYYQDIRAKRTAQLEYSISPFISTSPNWGFGNKTITGLSLNLSF